MAARDYDPSHINRYLQELAACFHRFYNACRIKGEEPKVQAARLKLADSVRSVLANCLNLLGVTKLKLMNLLPAMFLPILLCQLPFLYMM